MAQQERNGNLYAPNIVYVAVDSTGTPQPLVMDGAGNLQVNVEVGGGGGGGTSTSTITGTITGTVVTSQTGTSTTTIAGTSTVAGTMTSTPLPFGTLLAGQSTASTSTASLGSNVTHFVNLQSSYANTGITIYWGTSGATFNELAAGDSTGAIPVSNTNLIVYKCSSSTALLNWWAV